MINITKFYGVPAWAKNIVSSLTILALVLVSAGSLLAFPKTAEAAVTSYQSPTANAADGATSWTNPANAYADDSNFASNLANEDRHRYAGFDFSTVPSGAVITGIEVQARTWAEDDSCALDADLSWDAGSNFTSEKEANIGNSEDTETLGSSSDDWGHTWTVAELSSFLLRIQANDADGASNGSSNCQAANDDVFVDWLKARVHYVVPAYSISGSASVSANVLSLSGTSGASPQKGADGTQHMAVDWDEDQDGDPTTGTGWQVAPAGGLSFTPTFSGSAPNRTFTDSWSGSHTYPAVTASYTVRVMVYHGNTPGQDGDALASMSFDVDITPPEATISATKIVCDSEADLPNMSGGANITASTASTFLGTHPNCHLQSGWVFEWAPNGTLNPGDNIGAAGGAWTAFTPTNGSGVATAVVPSGSTVWVREQMQAGHVLFSGDTSAPLDDVSAEIYCSSDVLNYDNYDSISSPATGSTYHCVAFNALPKGTLVVNKVLVNDNGGTTATTSFSFKVPNVNGGNSVAFEADGSNTFSIVPGPYTVTEDANNAYTTTYSAGCSAGVLENQTTTCTITNNDKPGTLIVQKVLPNNNGGTATADTFSFTVDGGSPVAFESDGTNEFTVDAGTYTVAEVGTPLAGYTTTFDGNCDSGGVITVGNGETKTCVVTNDDIQPTLKVTKTVTNDNGGTKEVSDFTLFVDAQQVFSSIQNFFNAGTFIVSEQNAAGYTGVIGGDCAANGSVTLAIGENKNCTIVNDDNAPSLTLNKVVIDNSDNNGTTAASAWTLTATGATGFSGAGPSVSNGASFDAGTYDLSESGPAGYAASDWVCTGGTQVDGDTVTVALGQTVSCTITNDDIPLPLCSNGADDDGDGLTDAADQGCHSDLNASNPDSYDANGTSEGNESTLATCTDSLDNDGDTLIDLQDPGCGGYVPKVVVHKVLVNDNLGGSLTPGGFKFDLVNNADSFFDVFFVVEGSNTGSKTMDVAPGTYSVTEDATQGYTSTPSGDCSGSISTGQTKHCTFTNDDQATTVLVKKALINDSGKTNATTTFSFKLNGTGSSYFFNEVGEVLLSVLPGSYSVLEDTSTNAGYTVTHSESCSGSLLLGQSATCTITNNDKPACADGIENDNPSDGLIDENDPGCFVESGDGPVYNPNGQTEGNETTLPMCTDESDNDGDSLIDLADPDCAAFKPVLIVKKVLSYEGEIPPTFFDVFSFALDNGEPQSFDSEDGMNTLVLNTEGSHTIVETGIPSNWDFGSVYCEYDGQSAGESITNGHQIFVDAGDTVTCTFTNVWNPDFDCSDGLDNDGDGLADINDPACHLDNDPNNPNSYFPNTTTEVNNPPAPPGGGGGGADPQLFSNGSNGPFVLGASIGPVGEVLGDTCGLYMDKYLRRGSAKNDKGQTEKLQAFLNKWVKANLPITGTFGPLTEAAVKAFQASNPDAILKPWNLTSATGLVYITTLRQMNLVECPALTLELPPLTPWTDN